MKRLILFLSFIHILNSLAGQHPELANSYIIDRFVDPHTRKEVIKMVVPGKPPDDFRMPAVYPSRASSTLAEVPAYDWSFGCSATAAAMNAGYYDRTGYSNMYTGPTNGGVAPMNNSSWGTVVINGEVRSQCPISATRMGVDGRTERGHVDDYWIKYGSSLPDPFITNGWTEHSYGDCTGDYMKTNQYNYGNSDASTVFYFNNDGSPYSGTGYGEDGMYGFKLFFESRGYTVTSYYNQFIYGYNGNIIGFTFEQFKQEIDAGRPVLIQVSGHSMLGMGYDDTGSKVYLHDTWDYSTHEMTWGGSYSGMQHFGVGVIQLQSITLCEDCPDYDYSISPATGWSTHSSSHGILGCKMYRVSVTSGLTYTFKTGCGNSATATYNTLLELYSSSCSLLASNDDGCESGRSILDWTASYTGYAFLKVRGYQNTYGSYTLAYTSCPVPSQPSAITGNQSVCQGTSQSYSVTNISGTTYSWQVPSGWTITSGQGTNAITATAGAQSGTIQVTPSNSCGNGLSRTLAITVSQTPAQPSAITGPGDPCQGSQVTYSVGNVSGITFTWDMPESWSISSGQGTNSVNVTVGMAGGDVQVTPSNSCGSGPSGSLEVTVIVLPEPAGSITGDANPCQGTSQTYSIPAQDGVTCTWQVPPGWTIDSGQGTSSVIATVGALSGNVQVTPSNDCGNGTFSVLYIQVKTTPVQPSSVYGPPSPCQGTSQTYSVDNVPDVVFTWQVPAGWSITSGQGTGSITALAGSAGGEITVTPSNTCGNGPSRILTVNVLSPPGQPSAISGPINPCSGTSETYAVENVSGTTYSWQLPPGWGIISGQETHAVTAAVGAAGGNIVVIPSNSCGQGPSRSLAVSTLDLPSQPSPISGNMEPCYGQEETYSVVAIPGITYTWQIPSGWEITSGQGSSLITTEVGTAGGVLEVFPSNICGTGASQSVSLPVNSIPQVVPVIEGAGEACAGSQQTYSVEQEPGVTYYWILPPGWTITEGQGSSLISASVSGQGGTVSVLPSTYCGDGTVSELEVSVLDIPAAPTAITGTSQVCQGTIDVTFSIDPISNAEDYIWTYSGTGVTIINNGPEILVNFSMSATSGNLSVKAVNTCGTGPVSENLPITVHPPVTIPAFELGPSSERCQGSGSVIYSASSENAFSITYSLDPVSLGSGLSMDALTGTVDYPSFWTGVSVITASAEGCLGPSTASHTAVSYGSPVATFSYPGTPYCKNDPNPIPTYPDGGQAGIFTSSEGLVFMDNSTGEIDMGQSEPGTYTVTNTLDAGDACGEVTASAEIKIYSLPSVYAGADRSVPEGTSVTVSDASVYGFAPFICSWSPAGIFVDATVINPTTVELYETVICTLSVTDDHGCFSSSQMIITVTGGILELDPVAEPLSICQGGTSHLFAGAQGGSGTYSYTWTSEPAGFTSSLANPVVDPLTTTTYTVMVNDGSATAQESITVVVHPLPEMLCPDDIEVPDTDPAFQLSGASPEGGTFSGPGVSGGMFNPSTAGIGEHTITYSFLSEFGCSGSCSFAITVTAGGVPGDANGDGSVNVLDIIMISNYIMMLNPVPFNFSNADVNGDGIINVLDIVATINLILS